MNTAKKPNRLIHESSPYLLQHAYNPVDWHPWSEDVFLRAKEENKPVFLSIGYSACHWCHVMEAESFENEEIAGFLNTHFLSIKVDREERPDLDEIYMSSVQAMTGSGGWPLSVFLLPDHKPFYGGTYFPPHDRYGRPGFLRILQGIKQVFHEKRKSLEETAGNIIANIQKMMEDSSKPLPISYDWIKKAKKDMMERFDPEYGGFGGAPKFPHSMDLGLLLRDYTTSGDLKVLEMVEFTLQKMAQGGMFDHLGGGFHRYSVDEAWLVPHFEKMLYDNALLSRIYLEAYQVTRKPFYERIVRETLDYVLREMTSPSGGFYSSQDADSEGGEGAFFVWTREEIYQRLDSKEAELFCRYYGVEEQGNFEGAASVLNMPFHADNMEEQFSLPLDELDVKLTISKNKLFQCREQRARPVTDTKILTDWNALMISSLAMAGNSMREPRYIQAAEQAAGYLWDVHWREDELYHTYSKPKNSQIPGFLSDYAYLANALLDMYQVNTKPECLIRAQRLIDKMICNFGDEVYGGFFYTGFSHQDQILRLKTGYDSSTPSGNSSALMVLLRMYGLTGDEEYYRRVVLGIQHFADRIKQHPSAYSAMAAVVYLLWRTIKTAVIVYNDEDEIKPYQALFADHFIPEVAVLYVNEQSKKLLLRVSSCVEGKTTGEDYATVYLCKKQTCFPPVISAADLLNFVAAG